MAGMKALPLPEVLELISRLPAKYQAICAIGVTTGCRISEILALRRFDLLDSHGKLKDKIPFLKLKTKSLQPKHRFIAIPKPYQPFILQHLVNEEQKGYDRPDDLVFRGHNGKPMSRLTVYHMYRQYLGDGYGTHWMRKTFAQELFKYFIKKYCLFSMFFVIFSCFISKFIMKLFLRDSRFYGKFKKLFSTT